MRESALVVKCKDLPWTKSNDYNCSAFQETQKLIKRLFIQYGFATVIGTLSDIWKMERGISFWERYPFDPPTQPDGKLTVATFYTRAYNGGTERVQSSLIRIWTEMGLRVILITEEDHNPLDYPYPETVMRYTIPPSSDMIQRLQMIQNIIQEEKVNVYVNHQWYDSSVIWESALMRINRIPFIVYQHGAFPVMYRSGREFGYLSYRAFRLCNMILSLSESAAKFHQLCGCNSFYIQNPVPEQFEYVKENSKCSSRKRILWIGRIAEEKRTKDALLMMKELLEKVPDATLDIVGKVEKSYGEETLKLCDDLKLNANVRFHGYQKDVSDYYKNCDVLILTSETEGFALVLLEANAYGIPCVMYQLPFLSDISSEYGIISVPLGRTDLMAESVANLLLDDHKRWEYGKRSRERFVKVQAFDIQDSWQRVFNLCLGMDERCNNYFSPKDLVEYEKSIIPSLLSELSHALDNAKKDSPDYEVGHRILALPRCLSHAVRRMTGRRGKM